MCARASYPLLRQSVAIAIELSAIASICSMSAISSIVISKSLPPFCDSAISGKATSFPLVRSSSRLRSSALGLFRSLCSRKKSNPRAVARRLSSLLQSAAQRKGNKLLLVRSSLSSRHASTNSRILGAAKSSRPALHSANIPPFAVL